MPALYTDTGVEFVGKPTEYSKQKRDEYTSTTTTRRPTRSSPTGISRGVEDAELMAAVGYRVANADKFPEWKPGNEFKAKRDAMLKK